MSMFTSCFARSIEEDQRGVRFWGAEAASLFVSAACRNISDCSKNSALSSFGVVGRLPTTAGWQPALPRTRARSARSILNKHCKKPDFLLNLRVKCRR
jgi:hypothetical protein